MSRSPASTRAPLRPFDRLMARSLYLQPPSSGDMEFVRWLWADGDTMQPVGGPIVLTDDEASRWYARIVDPGRSTDCYCLIRLMDETPVGEVSFHRLEVRKMTADLNVKVMASMRGQGIAREALLRFMEYYFNSFGGRVLADDLAPQNLGGQIALARLGFHRAPSSADVVRFEMTDVGFRLLARNTGEPLSG